jgi:glycosyltransferase involved in cell wall biosynthesis
MRVWMLTQFYPPETGAAAVRLSRLARLLVEAGHDVTVITGMPNYPEGEIKPPYRGKVGFREIIDGVHVRRVWVYASPSKRARARLFNQFSFMAMAAVRAMFFRRPDVIFVESHPLFVTLAAGWLQFVKNAPIVLNVSDLWPESAVATGMLKADSLMVKVATIIERWAYNRAAHIVGMTQGVVDGINAVHGKRERVSLITNAVDLTAFAPASEADRSTAKRLLGLREDQVVAIHIGNMSLTYNFKSILDAAAALPDVLFVFAGGGSQQSTIEAEISDRKLNNVKLLGVLPHNEMPRIWAAGDICLISLADHSVAAGTRPAKMYEAFATGTPTVAAIRGEGAALLSEASAGVVVDIGDSAAYISAVRELAENPAKRSEMGAAGRRYAEGSFSPQAVKDAYLALFERVRRK